ncbi:hypothetical protein C9426_31655 [Serratia sp. S1B]|nr:hypothetical protein C9426_31655 [Serratia sp. S1B]
MSYKVNGKIYGYSSKQGSPIISEQSRKIKGIVWVNILVQSFFPLSLSFTPAVLAASSVHTTTTPVATETYTLGAGESVETVAKKYGISIDELKKTNSYRTFSKPFTALTTGDEIDVPRNSSSSSPFSIDQQQTDVTDNKLAGYAMTGGTALANGNPTKSAAQMARSAASNKLNDSTQQWLNQFGTAKVQLNVDDHAHLDGSAVDVLVPFYDKQDNVLFTQLGARNKDSRNTLNMGVGFRLFHGRWMYGVNTFFDNDITGHNRRVGVGTEAWTDYLKLSANSYFGLSDWHQSRDFADYDESPANGYDVRAEAYLPAYPQLGGKLMYEQYQGNNVALFGKDHLQKDPNAVTVGLNYTPVPLLTLGAEQHMGNGGHSEGNFNLQFNYHLGESWKTHIDPSAVAASRTLAGSRYNLVERNNNIVLDYQKQELVRLSLPEQLVGNSESTLMLNAQVTAKYGLSHIDWDTTALVAAGGKVQQTSSQILALTLPNDLVERTYVLGAVAYDMKGNASDYKTVSIKVVPTSITIGGMDLVATNNGATLADGKTSNVVSLSLTDAQGNSLPGYEVTFTVTDVDGQIRTVKVVTDENGIAPLPPEYTTSRKAGDMAITANVNSKNTSITLKFVADPNTATIGPNALKASNTGNTPADGKTSNTVTLPVTDTNGNPLADYPVTFEVVDAQGNKTQVPVKTDANGIATLPAEYTTSEKVGTVNITASVGGHTSSVDLPFTAEPNTATIDTKGLKASNPGNTPADGKTSNTVSLSVTDANGNPLADYPVTFEVVDTEGNKKQVTVNTDANGVAILPAEFTTSQKAGDVNISATVGGTTSTLKLPFVGDSNNLDANKSTLTVSKDSILADGAATSVVTLTLLDINNNPVTGQTVKFTTTLGAVADAVETSPGSGIYAASLKSGTETGTANLTVNVNATPLNGISGSVVFAPVPVNITAALSDTRKNIGDTITLTLTFTNKETLKSAPNVKVTFGIAGITNRQGNTVTSGKLQINGKNYDTFSGVTDANGQLVVSLTDPNGIGVQTTLQAKAESNDTQQTAVIFNVKTSPDTDLANMWGYMPNTLQLTDQSVTFKRPFLQKEKATADSVQIANEVWARFTLNEATATCSLPTKDQLIALYNQYPGNAMSTNNGWPTATVYRSSTIDSVSGQHYYVQLRDGASNYNVTGVGGDALAYNLSCIE